MLVRLFALLVAGIVDATLGATRVNWAGDWIPIRRVSEMDQVSIMFVFRRSQAQLKQLEAAFWAVSDPDSSQYGHHLTQNDVTKIVSPSALAKETVQRWLAKSLQGQNYTEDWGAHGDLLQVELPGPAAESLLKTEFTVLKNGNRAIFRSGGPRYSLPDDIDQVVSYVANVHHVPAIALPRSHSSSSASRSARAEEWRTSDDISGWASDCGKCSKGFDLLPPMVTPGVLAQRYNLGTAPNSSDTIRGSVAVAEFTGVYYDQTDLDVFSKACSLPSINVTQVGQNRPASCMVSIIIKPNICKEALLDIMTLKGIIGAIPLTDFYNKEYSILSWAKQIEDLADGTMPLVHSVSYGNDESQQTGDDYIQAVNVELQKLGVRGATLLFASGDGGVLGRRGSERHFHAGFPASSPFVTAVGGTDFVQRSVIGEEEAWSGSGGGFSDHFAVPDYQAAAVAAYKANASSRADYPAATKFNNSASRGFPDVSALGGERNQYCIAAQRGLYYAYGTSASTPVLAGVVAKLNEIRLAKGASPLGFVNPLFYKHPEAFQDVTRGNNGNVKDSDDRKGGFPAIAGWDPATGLGTPDFEKLKSIV